MRRDVRVDNFCCESGQTGRNVQQMHSVGMLLNPDISYGVAKIGQIGHVQSVGKFEIRAAAFR